MAGGRVRCTLGFWLRDWVDGAEKRDVSASGGMYDWGQVEFQTPLGHPDRCSGDSWTKGGRGSARETEESDSPLVEGA